MTLQEAFKIARDAKPKKQPARIALDKLHGSSAAAQLAAGATALSKKFEVVGLALDGMRKRLDRLEEAVEYLQGPPGQPLRRFHS